MTRVISVLALAGSVVFLMPDGRVRADLESAPSGRRAEFGPWAAPVNLGPIVNSQTNDAAPAISRDNLSLYFHSPRAGAASADLYVARRAAADLPWGTPVNLGATLSSAAPDAGPTLSKDGHYLFFGSLRAGTFDVYVSWRRHTHDDFAWEAPVLLPASINGPSFDVPSDYVENVPGGRQLYFASDRAGGGGPAGLDIYMSEQHGDGTWGEPVFATELNSAFGDDRPTVRFDGLEVIFDSSRNGDQDLYVSRREHAWEPWSPPENLGATINSSARDIHASLSADGTTLYFASARDGSLGSFDLYASTRPRLRRVP